MKLLIACTLVALASVSFAAEGIRVVRADEGWSLGARQLKPGDPLAATAELKGTPATPLILDCGKSGWLSYSCSREQCRVPVCSTQVEGVAVQRVDVHAAGAETSSSLGDMLAALLKRDRRAPQTLGVRSGGNPNDAIVLASGNAVHWGPALTRVLEGRYCFRLASLPAGGAARTFTLEWDRATDREGIAPMPNLPPGVYSLEKGKSDCRFDDPDSAAAWVLVAPDADFGRVDAQWKAYAASIRQLEQSGTSPAVLSTVRHAVLSALGDSIEKK